MKPGIYPDMPEADYRAINAVNISSLLEIERSPAHYRVLLETPETDSPSMFIGRALHSLVLYGRERYAADYLAAEPPCPAPPRTPKDWKAMVDNMTRAILQNDSSIGALTKGHAECVIVWEHRISGILCKGRLDRLIVGKRPVIVDLKTTTDARPYPFAASIIKYHYHAKAAFYRMGVEALTGKDAHFLWFVVEKDLPHGVAAYSMPSKLFTLGMLSVARMLDTLKTCRATDNWPGYPTGVIPIDVPEWAYRIDPDFEQGD